MKDDRAYKSYEREIKKDELEIERHKINFIKEIKGGLGDRINDINSYVKKEPSKWEKVKSFMVKVFRHI